MLNYFDDNEFMPLYNNIKIQKEAYLEFKRDLFRKEFRINTIENAKHELYDYDKEIIDLLKYQIFK